MPKRLVQRVSRCMTWRERIKVKLERKIGIPRTITKAALYGNGSVKLKESSSGSTLGSPSIAIAGENTAESLNENARESDAKNDCSERARVDVV